MKSDRRSPIERERDEWRKRAQSLEAILAQAQVEIAEAWRASRAASNLEQRLARREGR